jgi:hypothetical protein
MQISHQLTSNKGHVVQNLHTNTPCNICKKRRYHLYACNNYFDTTSEAIAPTAAAKYQLNLQLHVLYPWCTLSNRWRRAEMLRKVLIAAIRYVSCSLGPELPCFLYYRQKEFLWFLKLFVVIATINSVILWLLLGHSNGDYAKQQLSSVTGNISLGVTLAIEIID